MKAYAISRRRFLGQATALATGAILPATLVPGQEGAAPAPSPKAADQVELGRTGLKLSRLGLGTGTNSGNVQRALGPEGFTRLIRHAYDRGITYFDTAQNYNTHELLRDAIKGLPREKLFIQTKLPGIPENPLAVIDRFRKELDTDYVDSLLTHCAFTPNWDDERRRVLDAILEAQEKQWVRARGVSCHSLPALQRAVAGDWVQVHLVRINPQGAHMDTAAESWSAGSGARDVLPVVAELRKMRERGRGVIGMKIFGNGDFTDPADREKSIRFAISCGLLSAVVIGFKSPAEIDEAIERIDRAPAAA